METASATAVACFLDVSASLEALQESAGFFRTRGVLEPPSFFRLGLLGGCDFPVGSCADDEGSGGPAGLWGLVRVVSSSFTDVGWRSVVFAEELPMNFLCGSGRVASASTTLASQTGKNRVGI